ncbi:MAG: thioredoxin family protein, partial [Planctomycetota bacterium]|nr:thioredoxin family protein [Planctomycetota bacterium]
MWAEHDEAAFEEARERGLPVLVLIGTARCPASARMRRGLEERAGALEGRFVLVSADREDHPEVDAEHRGAGWPTLVVLDSDGTRSRRIETADPEEAVTRLLSGETAPDDDRRPAHVTAVSRIGDVLLETADPEWGGWGARQKFPHPDALHMLLVRWSETGDERMLRTVTRTLRSMQGRPIHDGLDGGFYRYATERDWSAPSAEKPLLSNAKRLLAYAEAYQVLGEPSFRDTALDIAAWMDRALRDERTGAYRASEELHPEAARLRTAEGRAALPSPTVDPTIHADRNAWAVMGLLKAGLVLQEPGLVSRALAALDFVLARMFEPSRGVYAYWNGTWNQPGDLRQQAAVLRALVDAVHSAGVNHYLEPAQAIAVWADERLTATDGSFRSDLHQRELPAIERSTEDLKANALMAEGLLRLAVLTGETRWQARARAALEAFLGAERSHGYEGAGYGRALDLLVHAPLHVTIV